LQKIDGTTIRLNRGDVLNLSLTLKLESGSDYTFEVGDKIVFSVYKKSKMNEKAVLLKEITVSEQAQSVTVALTKEETKIGEMISKPVEYWYEVELNDQYTVIGYDDDGPKLLVLYPEGSKISDGE
jgi:hypothetical protein